MKPSVNTELIFTPPVRRLLRYFRLHHMRLLPECDTTMPDIDRLWTVYEYRFNCVGKIKRPYLSFSTKREAIYAINDAMSQSEHLMLKHGAHKAQMEIRDGKCYQLYYFNKPCNDIVGFAFSVELLSPDQL